MKLILYLRGNPSGPARQALGRKLNEARALGCVVSMDHTENAIIINTPTPRAEAEVSAEAFEAAIRQGQAVKRTGRTAIQRKGRLDGEAIGPLLVALARAFGLMSDRQGRPYSRGKTKLYVNLGGEAGPEGGVGGFRPDASGDTFGAAAWADAMKRTAQAFEALGRAMGEGVADAFRAMNRDTAQWKAMEDLMTHYNWKWAPDGKGFTKRGPGD